MRNYSTSDPIAVADDFSQLMNLPKERVARVIELKHWLMTNSRFVTDTNAIVDRVANGIRDAGVPLDRMTTAIALLHSERAGVARIWTRGESAREVIFPYRPGPAAGYFRSPFHVAHETRDWVRIKLSDTPDDQFDVVKDLKSEGIVDYFCVPVLLGNGMHNGFTFGTRAKAGFNDDDMLVIGAVMPELATLMELLAMRRILNEVTRIYVGREPHERILSGDVRRGEVMRIRSAIMFADMRDFTTHSMELETEAVAALLNRYYDCVVPGVEAQGGEVLKFIGDGILAIFRSDEVGENEAVRRAVEASRRALDAVEQGKRDDPDARPFDVGIGLHVGEAGYGNVGSGERLDYTVIGRDVNIAARIAGLCAQLSAPLLVSADCAQHMDSDQLIEAGEFLLKGVRSKAQVYRLSN